MHASREFGALGSVLSESVPTSRAPDVQEFPIAEHFGVPKSGSYDAVTVPEVFGGGVGDGPGVWFEGGGVGLTVGGGVGLTVGEGMGV